MELLKRVEGITYSVVMATSDILRCILHIRSALYSPWPKLFILCQRILFVICHLYSDTIGRVTSSMPVAMMEDMMLIINPITLFRFPSHYQIFISDKIDGWNNIHYWSYLCSYGCHADNTESFLFKICASSNCPTWKRQGILPKKNLTTS